MNPKTATIAAADSSTHGERKSFLFFYRGCRFCLASRHGQATTGQIAEWCRPHLLERGQGFKIKYSSFVIIRRAGERPRRRRAAERGQEFSSLDVACHVTLRLGSFMQ